MSRFDSKEISLKFETFFSYSSDGERNDSISSLWVAVVYQAIKDVEDLMSLAKREFEYFGVVNLVHKFDLQKIFYEIESHWFEMICLESDVDLKRVKKVIDKLIGQSGFNEMTFTDAPKRMKIVRKTIEN